MNIRRLLPHLCLVINLFVTTPETLLGQVTTPTETAKESIEERDDRVHPLTVTTFSVANLPVWQLNQAKAPRFDASVVVSHIKSKVEPEIWSSGKARIVQSAKNESLVLAAPAPDANRLIGKVTDLLRRMNAFAEHDASGRLAMNLERAGINAQQIVVFCSDPDSTLSDQFFAAQNEDLRLQRILRRNYIIQCVPPQKAKELTEYGIVEPSEHGAGFTIVDAGGNAVAQQRFEDGSDDGLGALTEFLEHHANVFPDAKQILEAALEQAKNEDKRVLIQMGGPSCGPCIRLAGYLSGQKDLISKDYVYVKIDWRMTSAEEVQESLGAGLRSVPWMVVLSDDGKPLVNSRSLQGNIGFPENDSQKLHFRKMIESTSRRLSKSDIETLMASLSPFYDGSLPSN